MLMKAVATVLILRAVSVDVILPIKKGRKIYMKCMIILY